MLPTKGYFQDIECPYYDSTCNRPYCHFRHRKKAQEVEVAVEEVKEEVPTYKPTPKSELANIKSHIPISYVPDLAFRPDRTIRPIPKFSFEKPTYKPTPLSILSSAKSDEKESEDDAVREIKQNMASVEYNPEESLQNEINFEDLSAEFDLIDDLMEPKKENGESREIVEPKKENGERKERGKEKPKSHKSKHHKKDTKDRKERDREKRRHKSSKEKSRSREKDKKSKREKDRHKEKKVKVASSDDDFPTNLGCFSDVDLEDEDTLSECYKIFKEYEPPKVEAKPPEPPVELPPAGEPPAKKRVAHSSAEGPKMQVSKPKPLVTPAQMMLNRFKVAKVAQADNEQRNIMNEVRKRPPTLLEAARNHKLQRLEKAEMKKKKIAPVQNVNSIQRAKARIEELAKLKACEVVKTPAQTAKGAKRVAHVPDISLSDIPDVLNADKSKLPINVRTRFLTMIADECVKLYLRKEDAYNRALNEEFSCYEKCKVLVTYKNSAMLAVNRLRKEQQERERLGLGLIGEGECASKDTVSDFKGKKFYKHVKKYILSEEELDVHGYPKESTTPGRATIKNRKNNQDYSLGENQKKCARCSKIYLVDDDGFALYDEECMYHPLKKRTLRGEQTYLCCKTNDDMGCVTASTHVSESSSDELDGFQTTMQPESDDDPRNYSVYALDCEMCYTIKGLELTRVTIVDSDCKTVYETLVKPLNPIIDYNTTFSGITREQMERTSTSILQVQANILHLCNSKTILIGHSLESDLKALKIVHGSVVDTSVLFPHKMGLPHKRALKVLASEYLKKIIQNSVSGHDSAEDAIACMELVKWKLKEELKLKK